MQWETAAGAVPLGTVKQRTMLAALAVDRGRLVSWSVLVDRVWDQAPAADARRVLYTYANRIRRLLEALGGCGGCRPPRLTCRSGGYVLEIDPDLIDVHRF